MVEALGYYRAPDYCRVLTRFVQTHPSRQHLAFIRNRTADLPTFTAMFNVSFPHLTLPVDNITMLSYVNDTDFAMAVDDQLPFTTDHAVFWPALSTPILINIVCSITLGCCMFKLIDKYGILVQRVGGVPVPRQQAV